MNTLRVLHVEDEPDIREIVEISLALDSDFVTRSCGSGHEALAVAQEWSPDIILMDVMMPVMDGPATLARLRDSAETATIPVVLLTACAQSRELELFRSLGIAGVIPKPFEPMGLAALVRTFAKPAKVIQLGALRKTFLRRLNEDAVALATHRHGLGDIACAPGALCQIKDIAHGLAGAGGIFGFVEISDAAATLEEVAAFELVGSGVSEQTARALDHLLFCIKANGNSRMETSHS